MPKKFNSVEERRAYWKQWYERNKHREDYKKKDRATKKRIRKERREWYLDLKRSLKCSRCGIDDFRVLDLHHLDPSQKDLEVSNLALTGHSEETILKEIEKCICLCSNCHRIEHWEENNKSEITD